jgi:hypothetical protein
MVIDFYLIGLIGFLNGAVNYTILVDLHAWKKITMKL